MTDDGFVCKTCSLRCQMRLSNMEILQATELQIARSFMFDNRVAWFTIGERASEANFGIASQDGGNYEFTSNGRETMWLSVIKTQWHVQILWSIAQKRLRTKSSFVHSFCFLDKIHVIYCIYLNRNCRRTHMGVGGMGMVDVGRASVFILLFCHNNLSLVRHRE